MRIRNVWFDLLTFLAALVMVLFAVGAIVGHVHDKGASIGSTAVFVGICLLCAFGFLRVSLAVGDSRRRAREVRAREEGGNR